MRRRSWFARVALGTVAAGALLATELPASKADCTWGVLYITRKNADSIPVWGPGCITPDTTLEQSYWRTGGMSTDELPDGSPNGYYYEVLATLP